MSRYAELLVYEPRKILNLDLVPQLLRAKLYNFLADFGYKFDKRLSNPHISDHIVLYFDGVR